MNFTQLSQAIQDYSENYEETFVENIPTFIQQAEKRIYNSVQLPSLRKNVTGTVTASNSYLACPDDYLSTYSLAVIDGTGRYEYLLNKDVNFIRESYPSPTDTGIPKYYALFGSQYTNINELSFILGPTPDSNYSVELHYFYYPQSIVQGMITGLDSLVGGTGYMDGIYEGVELTGGSGRAAEGAITISGGSITSVRIGAGGYFYAVGDVLSAAVTSIGGIGDGNFSITVSDINNPDGTSWLGDNYDPALLYGSLREAIVFMKGEQDMVTYYEQKYQEAIQQLNRLGTGLERGDAYRDGQAKIKVNP